VCVGGRKLRIILITKQLSSTFSSMHVCRCVLTSMVICSIKLLYLPFPMSNFPSTRELSHGQSTFATFSRFSILIAMSGGKTIDLEGGKNHIHYHEYINKFRTCVNSRNRIAQNIHKSPLHQPHQLSTKEKFLLGPIRNTRPTGNLRVTPIPILHYLTNP
jgi:hypothetical protein